MRAPAIWVDLLIFIGQCRLEGPTMQIQLNDIRGGERLLRETGKEEFVDDARTRDANGTLLGAGWMGRHDHAAQHALGPHRHLWAVVEAAHDLTFWTLLELIRRQVQTRLNERMVEHRVLFAAGHKGEASQISKQGSRAILAVEPEQGALWQELVYREIPVDG